MSRIFLLLLATLPCLPACADAPSAQRQQELQYLLVQDCGSCHGMRLSGGLGPALTAEALAGKSPQLLFATIREGRTGTPMPPWKDLLADADIHWLVDYMLQKEHSP